MRHRLLRFGITLTLGLSGFTASAQHDRVIVVDAEDGHRFWIRATKPMQQPVYPQALMRAGISGCVTVGFFIESDGAVSGVRALSATTSARVASERTASIDMFVAAAAAAVRSTVYEPGPGNPGRTRGFAAIPYEFFAGTGTSARKCQIRDLKAFLTGRTPQAPGDATPAR